MRHKNVEHTVTLLVASFGWMIINEIMKMKGKKGGMTDEDR